jgi:PKD repeat protein/subtilisin family serine protease
MRKFYSLSLFLLFVSISINIHAQTVDYYAQDGKVIFQFDLSQNIKVPMLDEKHLDYTNLDFINRVSEEYGISSVYYLHPGISCEKLKNTVEIYFDEIYKVNELIKYLLEFSFIEYAETKELHYHFFTPNDQYYGTQYQYNLFRINAEQAWDISTGSASIVVAVTDDAIYTSHPDLVNKMVAGRDVAEDTNDPNPAGNADGFHGTHVSGIVGAETNNGTGIASIGFDVSIMPVKIARNSDGALVAGYDGVIWAADNGADVINMSWGGGSAGNYGQDVCNYAWNQGSILVAAAGNDGVSTVFYPAGYNNVVSVASTTSTDAKSGFSQFGTWIDISAPGSDIVSCNETGTYSYASGTSMASPLVSGLLGLMKSANMSLSNTEIIDCLYSSADNIDAQNPSYINQLGHGRINAYQALLCVTASATEIDAGIQGIVQPGGGACDENISPIIVLRNYGTEDINSVTINYQIVGQDLQTYEWTGNLSQDETEIVNLDDLISPFGLQVFRVYTSNPNGQQDQNPFNDELTVQYGVFDTGIPIPWQENFESGNFVTNLWNIDNPDGDITWEIYTISGTEPGDKAAGINNFNYSGSGQRDALLSPPLSFAGYETVELNFEHAYRRRNTAATDSLIIYISTDCGLTFQRVFSAGENGNGTFATAGLLTENFTPSIDTDWCIAGTVGTSCFSVNLDAFAGESNVIVKFETYNNNGNNIYIDNINIDGSAVPYDIGITEIIQPYTTVCEGDIAPEIVLQNFGDLTITSANIHYKLNEEPEDIFEWTGSIASGESTVVYLPIISPENGINHLEVYTSMPNGNDDLNTLNDEISKEFFVITHGVSLPFTEDFESGSFDTNNWAIIDPDMATTWNMYEIQGTSPGNKAAGINFFFYEETGERDGLLSPPLNFAGHAEIELSFEHSYRRRDQSSSDSLIIYISTDCGASFQRIFQAGENGTGSFATVVTSQESFFPSMESDWCHSGTVGSDCFTLDLSPWAGNPLVYIMFEAYNNNGNNLYLDNINIISTGASVPVAGFDADITEGCGSLIVQFADTSTGDADEWLWDFGDGNTSTQQNPQHEYITSGVYTVSLTASNSLGGDEIIAEDLIIVYELPVVNLGEDDAACDEFIIDAGEGWVAYEWNGNSGDQTYTVNESGTYTVVVTDNNGCTASDMIYIEIYPEIILTFETTDESETDAFDGTATVIINGGEPPYEIVWASSFIGETHTGLTQGPISVTVTDSNGCSATETVTIYTTGQMPIADFTADITSGCNEVTVQFTDETTNDPETWLWDFGDGNTSDVQNPIHTYSIAGTYSVSLTATNSQGNSEYTRDDYIGLGETPEFTINVTHASGPEVADGAAWLEITSGLPPYTINWSSGGTEESVEGLLPGTYSVLVRDLYNCMRTSPFVIDWANNILSNSDISFEVYPNPARDIIHINFEDNQSRIIMLFDLSGKLILNKEVNGNTKLLDISNLNAGIYTLSITESGKTTNIKIVVI